MHPASLHGLGNGREKKLVADFKGNPDGVRMLIVEDKLLTGFDASRNTFLYLAKDYLDPSWKPDADWWGSSAAE